MTSLGWLFYIGIFLSLSVYNLMVYAGRKEEKNNLYYALIGFTSGFWLFAKTLLHRFTRSPLILKPAGYAAVALLALTILLFSRYFFDLKKLKRSYILLGCIFLFVIPVTVAFFMLDVHLPIKTANATVGIPALSFGLLFWTYSTYLIFAAGHHKEKWKLYIYISTTIYSFCYFAYPLLAAFNVNEITQAFTATTGALIMLLAIAYFLAKKSNQEHTDLVKLKNTLEEKVRERTKRIEEMYQQKTDFFINLAHETKIPLTLITNYLEQDINRRGSSRELNIVKQNIYKLRQDMINFLDLEKLERGLIFYDHNQAVDLSVILAKKTALFGEIGEKKHITITCRIQKNLSVKIDPFAVDRIINNLLDNAVKYTDEDGKIRVNLHNFGNQVFLTVHNSGVLIPAEQQENIFKPFYQISHAKRNIQGIGMGLNIVKNILAEVDGTIEVKSAADAGTTFTVTFNRFGPSGSEKSISDIPLSTPLAVAGDIGLKPELYKKERKNILIVEDKPEMLAYLQDNLYDAYNVFLAENGRMAIERLEENAKPDIIVSDIMMDEMNGYEFYDTLMQNKKYSDIPFIFLTAMTADSDKIQGLKKGAVDYICKPFVIEELLQKIRSILRLQESLRKNQIARIGANITKILSEEAGGNNEIPAFSIICNDFKVNNNEKQIIKLLIRGLEYKEISRKLDITINIVKKRIHTIYKKFGVQNKIELVNCFKT